MYVKPAYEDFIERYPEFEGVSEESVDRLMDEAETFVGDTWIVGHRPYAMLAYVAHILYSRAGAMPALTEAYSEEDATGAGGPIVSKSVGPLSVHYATPQQSLTTGKTSAGGIGSATSLEDSPYGAYLLGLMRKSFPAVAVV